MIFTAPSYLRREELSERLRSRGWQLGWVSFGRQLSRDRLLGRGRSRGRLLGRGQSRIGRELLRRELSPRRLLVRICRAARTRPRHPVWGRGYPPPSLQWDVPPTITARIRDPCWWGRGGGHPRVLIRGNGVRLRCGPRLRKRKWVGVEWMIHEDHFVRLRDHGGILCAPRAGLRLRLMQEPPSSKCCGSSTSIPVPPRLRDGGRSRALGLRLVQEPPSSDCCSSTSISVLPRLLASAQLLLHGARAPSEDRRTSRDIILQLDHSKNPHHHEHPT